MEHCWRLQAQDAVCRARAGWLYARDGSALPTPLFQPVATSGSVRTLDWEDMARLGYRHVLMNTYHLVVRPGLPALEAAGGAKGFTGWGGSLLTDSGGYQVYSLAAKRSVREDGVRFTDLIEGARWNFTPRFVLEAQRTFGVDFAMCLDVCTGLPAERKQVQKDLALTHAWAKQQAAMWPEISCQLPVASCQQESVDGCELKGEAMLRPDQTGFHHAAATASSLPTENRQLPTINCQPPTANCQLPARLFGIVQGGLEEDLRAESAACITELPFDGVAVGGLAVGEAREDFLRFTELTGALLPPIRPHYLMGVGDPADLLFAIAQGFDMFDCVQPTRMARHGVAYTSQGKLTLSNARYGADARPLDPACACPVCLRHSRAYLRHLRMLEEHSYARLLTLHNLAFYKALMDAARERIIAGDYAAWWPGQYALLDRKLPEEL
jgi:queuine tRNA-ribosyltransferase